MVISRGINGNSIGWHHGSRCQRCHTWRENIKGSNMLDSSSVVKRLWSKISVCQWCYTTSSFIISGADAGDLLATIKSSDNWPEFVKPDNSSTASTPSKHKRSINLKKNNHQELLLTPSPLLPQQWNSIWLENNNMPPTACRNKPPQKTQRSG